MASKAKQSTALTVAKDFAIVEQDTTQTLEVMRENIRDTQLSLRDLVRVKMPAGGGLAFTISNPLTGKDESLDHLEGIIIEYNDQRAYWPGAYTGGNELPQCHSRDNKMGVGDPSGPCVSCEFAQFGTGIDGDGNQTGAQACKQMRNLFIVTPDDTMPLVLTLPPTSVGINHKYLLALASQRPPARFWQAITRITLRQETSGSGIKYSVAVPELAETDPPSIVDADSAEGERIKSYVDAIKPLINRVDKPITQSDVS